MHFINANRSPFGFLFLLQIVLLLSRSFVVSQRANSPLASQRAFTQNCISALNRVRQSIGLNPLISSDAAIQYASKVARSTSQLVRSRGTPDSFLNTNFGLTTLTGPRRRSSNLDCASVVNYWFQTEQGYYSGQRFTRDGLRQYGNFTQMLAHTSTTIGCAFSNGPRSSRTVCAYGPKGNRIGSFLRRFRRTNGGNQRS